MLTSAASLIGAFIACADGANGVTVAAELSTQTGFLTSEFVDFDNFRDIFDATSSGHDFTSTMINKAFYTLTLVALILLVSVGFWLLVYQSNVAGCNLLLHL